MITMANRGFTLFFTVLLCFSILYGGADNCVGGQTNLIRMCKPVTVTHKARFTMEFSDFELSDRDICQCSFIAPSRGNFNMAPTPFTTVNNCGTTIEVMINNVVVPGGRVSCKGDPFLPADAYPGENVTVSIKSTSTSSRIAPYCYVATFPVNITFTCSSTYTTTTPVTTTARSVTTTTPAQATTTTTTTSTTISTTTTPTTTTLSTNRIGSSSSMSVTSINQSSTSSARSDSVPMDIVIPAAVGGGVAIVLIIVVSVVCCRRSKSPTQTTGGGYQNEVFNDKDSSSDGIKDNVLYNSMGDNYPDMNGGSDGHYSSVIRHSTKLDEDSHKMKELPQSANQEPQGPVYAVVDKGQKRPSGPTVANKPSVTAQTENANSPVYAVPDKSQNKAKEGKNAVYDVPKNNSPVASPVRTSNQDGLLYSEIEHVGQIPELPSRKSDPKPNDTVVYSEVRTEL